MIEGVDYSEARPGGARLASAGKKFAMRYVPYGGYSKGLTAGELKDLRSHGVSVGLVFESLAKRVLGGVITGPDVDFALAHHQHSPSSVTPYQAGQADAWQSQTQLSALGMPNDLPIYFAVDFDAAPGQQAAIDSYLKGAASIIGAKRVGVYGGYWVIQRCHANETAQWFWQTYAWSGGQVHPAIHILQYLNSQTVGGVKGIDLCRAYKADYGQFPASIPDTAEDPKVIADLQEQVAYWKAKAHKHWQWVVSLREKVDALEADLDAALSDDKADANRIKNLRARISNIKQTIADAAADVADA